MSDYKVSEVKLSTINYVVHVAQIPESEINDKLTYFTRERGLITKTLYDDFLIINCVPNLQSLVVHLQQVGISRENYLKVRTELIEHVLRFNPVLTPENLVINSNHVVKIIEGSRKPNDTSLTSNDNWLKDITDTCEPQQEQNHIDKSKLQLKDLSFKKVQQYWRRIGQYVVIKEFEPGSESAILGGKQFPTRHSFEQYVVAVCVDELEDLFTRLEKMNLRVSPPTLVHELYELCQKANVSLNYELVKEGSKCDSCAPVDPFESLQKVKDGIDPKTDSVQEKGRLKTFGEVKKETILSLTSNIKKKVVGQNHAIDEVVEAIQRASVGLRNPIQPIGSFVFTGFTGVGKTYTTKVLAEELTGSRNGIIIIDCSEYSSEHEYAKLIGSPSGYIGHDQGGILTNAIKQNPFSIILFDEIEKASDKVHQLMLQIMDEGRLTDGRGQKVSFKDTVVIMTSNLGVQEIQGVEKMIGFGSVSLLTKIKRDSAIKEALKKQFKPEFLNRLTGVIYFDPLSKEDYLKIIKLELEKLKENLKLNHTPYSKIAFKFDKSLYKYIYKVGIDEKFGARPLLRAIEREVSNPLAMKLLNEETVTENMRVIVKAESNKVCIDLIDMPTIEFKVDEPPFYMTTVGA